MKKLLSTLTVLTLAMGISATGIKAAEIDQNGDTKSTDIEITTAIDPSYVVVIPESTNIDFKEENTALGTVEATWVQIDPDKKVVVTADAGKLQNIKDINKTIPYRLLKGEDKFQSMDILAAGDKADLSVAISEADWNKAYAGRYKGIITFILSYEDIV